MNFLASQLLKVGRSAPAWLPRSTAIGNRILKPIYRFFYGPEWQTVTVWPGIEMAVNPCECIGGNLFFSPHLYDVEEREWIKKLLRPDGVFLDVGANIGAYTLWATQFLTKNGTALAIEADTQNHHTLKTNIEINSWIRCKTLIEKTAVSDKFEKLPFFKNTRDNDGANTFFSAKDAVLVDELDLVPLTAVLNKNGIKEIDFMKIDVEGFELKVLSGFFDSPLAKETPAIKPRFILIEIDEGPRSTDVPYKKELLGLLKNNGYRILHNGKNTLFQRHET